MFLVPMVSWSSKMNPRNISSFQAIFMVCWKLHWDNKISRVFCFKNTPKGTLGPSHHFVNIQDEIPKKNMFPDLAYSYLCLSQYYPQIRALSWSLKKWTRWMSGILMTFYYNLNSYNVLLYFIHDMTSTRWGSTAYPHLM